MARLVVGIIGLGKMGLAIAQRLLESHYKVVGYDVDDQARKYAHSLGIIIADSPIHLAKQVDVLWFMIPSGNLIDHIIELLMPELPAGIILVDGGNSKFTDSMKRAAVLAQRHIPFIDCGVSGGIHGKDHGFCLMVGGDKQAYDKIEELCAAIATPEGYGYMGPSGAGHYVKMIHNGIEYALLQAYAEGFHLLKDGQFNHLDLEKIASVWNHGSVIRSWILELVQKVVKEHPDMENISGVVEHTGMGAWTVEYAHKINIPVDLIERSLEIRKESQKTGGNFATKLVALLRNAFGGHTFFYK